MKSGKQRFCSSLLVNAILADSCHNCSQIQQRNQPRNPQNLGYQFLAEARRLWKLEVRKSKITTGQAGLIMVISFNSDGVDRVGWTYLGQAIQMAYDSELFTSKRVKVRRCSSSAI